MKRYQFTERERALLERSPHPPFAVYQFLNRHVVTIALSDGFCKLLGYDDPSKACYDMDHDMYRDVHPDDVARIAEAAVRFAAEDVDYDVIYRSKEPDGTKLIMGVRLLRETDAQAAD